MSRFFIDRPIFATVLALVIVIIGLIACYMLPIAEYPDIVPPTIVVNAKYPGASPQVIADTVATPLEQEINGVERMLYMMSQSTSDGQMSLTITFKVGTDLDKAQVLVQNRVAIAEPRLPELVRRLGVTTQKSSPDLLLVVHLLSPDNRYDQAYIGNYALINIRDVLARLEGVGSLTLFGLREFSMRVWLDPDKLASLNMTAGDVVQALREQNVQVAAGVIGQPPMPAGNPLQLSVTTQGRLLQPEQFADIIIKTGGSGRMTRLRDIARVELGARDYSANSYLDGKQAMAGALVQLPGSNALATANGVRKALAELSKNFPQGLEYRIVYDPTVFIRESVNAVTHTLLEAFALVFVVVLIFLQDWRATLLPMIDVPVSLIGTFGVMAALGFSLNNLSLFGLVLAIGIVVDDAIVVVENVERHIEEGLSPRDAAYRGMDEVGGAVVAIALVLVAVFLPTAFITGISGQFYRQFAVTISVATLISAFVSLSLSPALAALLLRPKHGRRMPLLLRPFAWFSRGFNAGFNGLARFYGGGARRLGGVGGLLVVVFFGLLRLTAWRFAATPQGFIPQQDRGYLIVAVQLPPGAALARTDAVIHNAVENLRTVPGVSHAVGIVGFSGATFTTAPNAGAIFLKLADYTERAEEGLTIDRILAGARQKAASISEGMVLVIQPPPVAGIGNPGGGSMTRTMPSDMDAA